MNNVSPLFKKPEKSGQYYAEAIPDGVKVYQKHSDNKYHEQEVIPFADVLARADAGEWDDNRPLALRLLAEWGGVQASPSRGHIFITCIWHLLNITDWVNRFPSINSHAP